ncbi:hypothetical protein LTR66_015584 [Elasticomyces elasticus]|nr:hypothetical protein LTR66_015584 [Elasticomyces elasticus]
MENPEIELNRPNLPEADLARLLPTCLRCRRLRRKCDTALPSCGLCTKGKADCLFFDHALQQSLPRSYVDSLIKRLARLRTVHSTITQNTQEQEHSSLIHNTARDAANSFNFNRPIRHAQTSFDKHFDIEHANPTCWQFYGSSSAYALAVEVLVNAQSRVGSLTRPQRYEGPQFRFNQDVPESLERQLRPTPNRHDVDELVTLYMSTSNIINGYANEGPAAYQFFRIAMICAIATANRGRHRPEDADKAFSYYVEATQLAEEVTNNVSLDSLQALLLLIQYSLFYPRRGDVWKLLDYACRLSVELNIHCEVHPDNPTDPALEDPNNHHNCRSIFWGLYSLERTFGQHLGRPSDLPEEIVTAEYPVPLNHDFERDGKTTQLMLVSHYYRLMYLRSEIFRALYMPAIAPELPHSWYSERLSDFVSWKKEYEETIDLSQSPGMGALQCEMGFTTSITFLFQPLLLRALAATKRLMEAEEVKPLDTEKLVIPYESYDAAVKTITFYERVLMATEGTAEGDYPVTILSAHYIHQAALTIVAHVLLAIDGRLPVITFYSEPNAAEMAVPQIDFTNIGVICTMSRKLLQALADRWNGMIGIFDLFSEMQEKVMPVFGRTLNEMKRE